MKDTVKAAAIKEIEDDIMHAVINDLITDMESLMVRFVVNRIIKSGDIKDDIHSVLIIDGKEILHVDHLSMRKVSRQHIIYNPYGRWYINT